MAAPLAAGDIPRLVLELDRSRTGRLEQPHRLFHVARPAEARVGIDDHRNRDSPGEDPRLLDELVAGEQPDVGNAERAG